MCAFYHGTLNCNDIHVQGIYLHVWDTHVFTFQKFVRDVRCNVWAGFKDVKDGQTNGTFLETYWADVSTLRAAAAAVCHCLVTKLWCTKLNQKDDGNWLSVYMCVLLIALQKESSEAVFMGYYLHLVVSGNHQTTSSSVKLPAHWGKVALTEVLLYFIRMGPKQLPSVNWHVQYNIGACTCTCMSRCFENWLLLSVNSQIYDVRSGWWNTIASHCVEWPSCVTGACYF